MKLLVSRYRFLGFLLLVFSVSGCDITAPVRSDGFADLGSLGFRDVDQAKSLSIGPTLLRFAAATIKDDSVAEMLGSQLDRVGVRTYDVDSNRERVAEHINGMIRKLQARAGSRLF